MNDNIIDSKVKRLWFSNYDENKSRIKYTIEDVPLIERCVVVGAAWGVEKQLPLLQDCKVPIIACDKIAANVAEYVQPFAVVALNTEPTSVVQWLEDLQKVCQRRFVNINDIWLIVPVTVDPAAIAAWKGEKIAFINPLNTCAEFCQMVDAETNIAPTLRGDNSGYFGVITAYTLGAEEIVMLGMKYCYYDAEFVWAATNQFHCVSIRDIHDNIVYTTLDWIDARSEFVNFCDGILEQTTTTRFLNASGGGILYEAGVILPTDLKSWLEGLKC